MRSMHFRLFLVLVTFTLRVVAQGPPKGTARQPAPSTSLM
jgi:hypothetical protein